ncbi:hypothetical protein NQ117_12190 [Paenibacillus sp. SC116]|uniref:hypothetical protein n=1 Tax=Paenibacillus sp. SC116 TaxID=2968986 RepID=UPI00215B09AA|nr:hypothetical protein [Paenibacillus sp. SC116]MCR8844445.1 hypothetical protein [Paenibacillus sp. SC116]
MQKVSDPLPEINIEQDLAECTIDHIEAYQFDTKKIASGITDIIGNRTCGLLIISSRNVSGSAEYFIPTENRRFDIIQWAKVFMELKGRTIPVALEIVEKENKCWGPARTNLAKASLMDLASEMRNPVMRQECKKNRLDRAVLFDYSQAYFSF